SRHASSMNASALIYTCALGDFADIDLEQYEIVAVTGNSLGWYLALAAAGALSPKAAITLIDTMGQLMEDHGVGGQIVYPTVDTEWRHNEERAAYVTEAMANARSTKGAEVYHSIHLGGMEVLAGNEKGLGTLEEALPQADERFPFRLARHAAFHTPLLNHVSQMAQDLLPPSLFQRSQLPMIDGRGKVWRPYDNLTDLWEYTLGEQIIDTYDFSTAVEVAMKEFAPDRLIVLGPGSSLGPPIAQTLIRHDWRGIDSKSRFISSQSSDPFVLAMGIEEQRRRVTR
ncbi:MAG: ACP S-malonyltransferase, partial [Pseudomonadota bacterium]